jgi:hypothetical protein
MLATGTSVSTIARTTRLSRQAIYRLKEYSRHGPPNGAPSLDRSPPVFALLAPYLGGWFVLSQPDIDRLTQQVVSRPGQIGDLGHKLRLDPMNAGQNEGRSEAR